MKAKAVEKKVVDFTEGSPLKHILGFYFPLLLTSMLQQLYNFADTFIVGKGLGDHALAAVGNMGSLFFLIVGFSFGLANGFGIPIAQSFGAKDVDQLRHRLAGTIKVAAVMAVALTIFSVLFIPQALRLLQTDELLMEDCLKYGYIVFGGLSMGVAYNISGSVLRALGDSRTPLKAIIISSIVNLSLDCLFIFGLKTGVEGAAAATVISQAVSAFVCIRRLASIEMIRLSASDFKNDKSVYIDLFKNGLPMALMNSITAIGCMVVQGFVNGYGVDYTTAYAACSKYINLFMNPAASAGTAMSSFTSQNYGAKEFGRIKEGLKICLGISFVSYLILGSLMVFAPSFLAGILLEGSVPISLACEYFPIAGAMLIAVNCLFVIRGGAQGMGHTIIPMWSGVAEMALRAGVIALFIGTVGFKAAALAEVSAWTGALLLNIFAFYRALNEKEKEGSSFFKKLTPLRKGA